MDNGTREDDGPILDPRIEPVPIILDIADRSKHICTMCDGTRRTFVERNIGPNTVQLGPEYQPCERCGGNGWVS